VFPEAGERIRATQSPASKKPVETLVKAVTEP
jgi:hypothetical protein